jgi:hypothetical protein
MPPELMLMLLERSIMMQEVETTGLLMGLEQIGNDPFSGGLFAHEYDRLMHTS